MKTRSCSCGPHNNSSYVSTPLAIVLLPFPPFSQHASSFIHYYTCILFFIIRLVITSHSKHQTILENQSTQQRKKKNMDPDYLHTNRKPSSGLRIKVAVTQKMCEDEFDDDVEEEEEEEEGEEDQVGQFAGLESHHHYGNHLKKKKTSLVAVDNKGSTTGGGGGAGMVAPGCQVEKCEADLTDAKKYHKRHKVCEVHAKAPVVVVSGLRQRFCQQCSRFHVLTEFDDAKRSCRRRLAGHNERRRKSSSESRGESSSRRSPNQCRQVDERGRSQSDLTAGSTLSNFHIH